MVFLAASDWQLSPLPYTFASAPLCSACCDAASLQSAALFDLACAASRVVFGPAALAAERSPTSDDYKAISHFASKMHEVENIRRGKYKDAQPQPAWNVLRLRHVGFVFAKNVSLNVLMKTHLWGNEYITAMENEVPEENYPEFPDLRPAAVESLWFSVRELIVGAVKNLWAQWYCKSLSPRECYKILKDGVQSAQKKVSRFTIIYPGFRQPYGRLLAIPSVYKRLFWTSWLQYVAEFTVVMGIAAFKTWWYRPQYPMAYWSRQVVAAATRCALSVIIVPFAGTVAAAVFTGWPLAWLWITLSISGADLGVAVLIAVHATIWIDTARLDGECAPAA